MSPMRTYEDHILRILGEATEPLFPSDITDLLNTELSASAKCTAIEVVLGLRSLTDQVKQTTDGRWP
jgi:hypothetical protein